MRALTIHQPWAWAIIHAGKNIENRTWQTSYRGPLLVHASRTKQSIHFSRYYATHRRATNRQIPDTPPDEHLHYGGIIGIVTLKKIVTQSSSPWFQGPYGWILETPTPLPWIPTKGRQGLWIPDQKLEARIRSERAWKQCFQCKPWIER